MKQLLTAEDVAKILQVNTQTVYQLKARHQIPFVKIGGAVRFDEEQIQEWIESKRK